MGFLDFFSENEKLWLSAMILSSFFSYRHMKSLLRFALAFCALSICMSTHAADPSPLCYELRTYHPAEGKLEALQTRFREHTMALFEKHGMSNIAYWVPKENPEQILIYLLAYPSREAREASWKAFLSDPVWVEAKAHSEEQGKLVEKVDSVFLHPTDYTPEMKLTGSGHLYELRHYTTLPGRLAALDTRFRDHTIELFRKQGMHVLSFFHLDPGQEGADTTLIYFLAHDSAEKQAQSFAAFRSDPEWIRVRDASEEDGKILGEKAVTSTLLLPTDYSPMQ